MVNCTRCFLKLSVRTVNLIVILCGIAMIIYSLWLLKKWREGFLQLGSVPPIPKPGFIYACIGVGIVVCLSMVIGHAVVHCVTIPGLAVYVVSIFSVFLLEVVLIVMIFFKMDWGDKISKYIDSRDDDFKNFLYLHLTVCRLISVIILIAQANAVILTVILWAIGPVPRNHCRPSEEPEFKQSFLIRSDSPILPNGNGTEQI